MCVCMFVRVAVCGQILLLHLLFNADVIIICNIAQMLLGEGEGVLPYIISTFPEYLLLPVAWRANCRNGAHISGSDENR